MTTGKSLADIQAEAHLDFDPRATPEYQRAIWGPELGALIRRVRKTTDMSQTKLAAVMDSSQSNVARLEAGSNIPTIEMLGRISQALGKQLVIGIVDYDKCEFSSLADLVEGGQISIGLASADDSTQEELSVHLFEEGDWESAEGSIRENTDPPAADVADELQWNDLVEGIATYTGQDTVSVGTSVHGLIDVIMAAVSTGRPVELPGIAQFSKLRSPARPRPWTRTGRKTGQDAVEIKILENLVDAAASPAKAPKVSTRVLNKVSHQPSEKIGAQPATRARAVARRSSKRA